MQKSSMMDIYDLGYSSNAKLGFISQACGKCLSLLSRNEVVYAKDKLSSNEQSHDVMLSVSY